MRGACGACCRLAACKSGTMTTSNSRPLDLWMVMNCTPHSLLAAGSGRAVNFSRAASSAGLSRSCSPPGRLSRQLQRRSRLARAVASTQLAPPRLSQTCCSQVPREAVGWRRGRAGHDCNAFRTRRGGAPAFVAQQMQPCGEQSGMGRTEQLRFRRRWRACGGRRGQGRTRVRARRRARRRGPAD